MVWFALNWLFLAGLYLAFTGQVSGAEVAVALSGAFAATAYRLGVGRFGRAFSSGLLPAIELSPRILAAVCRDVGKLTLAFLKLIVAAHRPQGSFVDIAFDPGRGDPSSRRRRGLVVTGISFAPNTYVVAIRRPQQRLTLHALMPLSGPKDVQWPL
ncbi:MAG TPA: hypothetical protein VFT69_19495 [Pseudolabrys sp.]|jgi:hypothetical protein|nr:hypothetical protein [Pseudolabrys sp.]